MTTTTTALVVVRLSCLRKEMKRTRTNPVVVVSSLREVSVGIHALGGREECIRAGMKDVPDRPGGGEACLAGEGGDVDRLLVQHVDVDEDGEGGDEDEGMAEGMLCDHRHRLERRQAEKDRVHLFCCR